jgi:hypothetical protein
MRNESLCTPRFSIWRAPMFNMDAYRECHRQIIASLPTSSLARDKAYA